MFGKNLTKKNYEDSIFAIDCAHRHLANAKFPDELVKLQIELVHKLEQALLCIRENQERKKDQAQKDIITHLRHIQQLMALSEDL